MRQSQRIRRPPGHLSEYILDRFQENENEQLIETGTVASVQTRRNFPESANSIHTEEANHHINVPNNNFISSEDQYSQINALEHYHRQQNIVQIHQERREFTLNPFNSRHEQNFEFDNDNHSNLNRNESIFENNHDSASVFERISRTINSNHIPNFERTSQTENQIQYEKILKLKEAEVKDHEARQAILKEKAEIKLKLLQHEEELIVKRQQLNKMKLQQHRPVRIENEEIADNDNHQDSFENSEQRNLTQKDPIEKLSDAIIKAIQFNSSSQRQNDNLDKFLTRQGIDKDLPIFSGHYEEWPNFIAQYKVTTNICKFSDAENLIRLQKCLKGEAKETVQALLISPLNIQKIITTLSNRFGRSEYIIETLLEKVRTFQTFKDDNFDQIISFANNIQNIVATIETLGNNGYLNNSSLRNELMSKLPVQLKMKWAEHIQFVEDPNLVDFSNWLQNISTYISRIYVPKNNEKQKQSENKNKKIETVLNTNNEKAKHEKIDLEQCQDFKKLDVDARWKYVTENNLCFSCLKPGHITFRCRKKKKCNVNGCKRIHHTFLHKENSNVIQETAMTTLTMKEAEETIMKQECDNQKIHLRIIPVKLFGPLGEINTYALLDEGSTVSLINEEISIKLGLTGPIEKLNLRWTNDMLNTIENSQKVSVEICGTYSGAKMFKLNNARTIKNLSLPIQTIDVQKVNEKWPYLKNVSFESMTNAKPMVLIGQDNILLTVPRQVIHGKWNEPVATKTWLGWLVHGRFEKPLNQGYVLHLNHLDYDEILHKLVKDSFADDYYGVENSFSKKILNREEKDAIKIMEETTSRINNDRTRFETGLLWKDKNSILPESKTMALKRLYSVEKKLAKENLSEKYDKIISEYQEKNFCIKLSSEEAKLENSKTWYLPHFPVINPNKPGKVRMVFDAAAKSFGKCLNDFLSTGPDLLKPLPGIIWKFRQRQIAIIGDIKEMFPQVKIRLQDQSSQRFLWRSMETNREPDTYQMTSMIFGASCSPASAQYVKNRNAEEFREEYPEAFKAITQRHYMDDYLDSVKSEEEAIKRINEVQEIHSRGGFLICNWLSSSDAVLQHIPEKLRAKNKCLQLNANNENLIERVLGLLWNAKFDCFTFSTDFNKIDKTIVSGIIRPTKRQVLKLVMSIYDPLGFLSHFIVKARILLQEIWKSEIGWDDELTDTINIKWLKWITELTKINTVKIPRCYTTNLDETISIELHTFCDASEKAMAAVSYFRFEYSNRIEVSFITSKIRVAPLKNLTIPRLELKAAVLASRLVKTIKEEHEFKIDKTTLWSDSKTVLCWIRSETCKFKQYVANRIGEIEENTNNQDWNWISTKLNVSDDATRDNQSSDFDQSSRWFAGPQFLKQDKLEWPKEKVSFDNINEDELEINHHVGIIINKNQCKLPIIASKFSCWMRLIRTTAWTIRFMNNVMTRIPKITSEELIISEIEYAEQMWWKEVQKECFNIELNCLKNNIAVPTSSKIFNLSPMLDDNGIIRINGRLSKSPHLNEYTKWPVILDPKHPYTVLLLNWHHLKANHHGQERVVNELKQKYFILQTRAAVRKTWTNCQLCKNRSAVPHAPIMAPLPSSRVTRTIRPFYRVGIDYFGPLTVKIGRRNEKRYGVLFVCMVTRAVHLEIAASLSTDSTILAIRRFIGRRGYPLEMFSDNGTNLRGADNELKKSLMELDQKKITRYLTDKAIKWNFIPPASPHMGGSWERLVKSVKIAINAIFNERSVTEEVLQTVFIEAESIVNSRPLTHVSLDPHELEALTPNHFLIGSSSGENTRLGIFHDSDLVSRKHWRIAQKLSDQFWSRWMKEYLPTLTRRSKWYNIQKPIQVGDIVLIADPKEFRNNWPMGRVTAIYPGKDGIIRVVKIRTSSGEICRSVANVAILDVEPNNVVDGSSTSGGSMSTIPL